jgi:succinate dehydrogenase / fumarate reductase, cytochrome b subunit
VIALFVIVHVKQFKYGAWYETASANPIRDLARTEFEVFSQPAWVALPVVAALIVALHLRHGISSSFQSLGLDHPVYTRRLTVWGIVFAVIVGGGLACIPVWVYLTR